MEDRVKFFQDVNLTISEAMKIKASFMFYIVDRHINEGGISWEEKDDRIKRDLKVYAHIELDDSEFDELKELYSENGNYKL